MLKMMSIFNVLCRFVPAIKIQSSTQQSGGSFLSDNIARTSRPLFEGASGAQLSVTVATGEI